MNLYLLESITLVLTYLGRANARVLLVDGNGIGFENPYTATRIIAAPTMNCPVKGVPNKMVLQAVDVTTETPVAIPFNTLSAYLITAATSNPPPACNHTKTHTHPVKP